MAFTAFVSKSKPGNQAHNERDFDVKHPEPAYFLAHWHRGDNIYIKQDLTAKEVYRDYVRTSAYGRKSGRLHHSAKPVREAVIVCKMDTTEKQVRTLIRELEKGLGIRALYAHVHKDEGHFDEKIWRVKHNPHIHFGYTNLVIERDEKGHRHGRLTDMNKTRMQQAQDICALALGMERAPHYTKETRKKNLPHQVYRAQQQAEAQAQAALDAAEEKTAAVEDRAAAAGKEDTDLVADNRALRNKLKNSGIAKQADYQGLKQIKDSDLALEEKVVKMAEYVDKVLTRVEETPAEELPAPSPITPERGVATTLGVPRRRQPNPPVATPPPVQVQAPAPAVPLFADVMRNWMQQEKDKRKAAAEEAEVKAAEKVKAAESRATSAEELAGKETTRANQAEGQVIENQTTFVQEAGKYDKYHTERYNRVAAEVLALEKQRDQAQGMMRTLARFIIAIARGFSPKKWPASEVESIANTKPDRWFKDEFFKSVGEKLNNLVDRFDTSQKTAPAPTKALDDDEQEQ